MRALYLTLLSLVGVLLSVPSPARADNCRRVGGYAPAYVTPYTPPTYHDYDYHENVILVPKAFEVVRSPLYAYTSVGDEFRLAYFADLVAQRMVQAADAKRILEQPAPQPQPGPAPPLATPGAVAAPPPIPPAAQPQTRAAAPLAVAQKMVADNCATCHKPGSSRLQLDFAKLNRSQLAEVHFRLTTGSDKVMPPAGHKPVGEAELNAVDALLAATN